MVALELSLMVSLELSVMVSLELSVVVVSPLEYLGQPDIKVQHVTLTYYLYITAALSVTKQGTTS